MKTILVTGGTGLIGKVLCEKLQESGYRVCILSRKKDPNAKFKTYVWDLEKNEIENEAIATADYIIHLAGAPVLDKKWSQKRKQLLIDSRVKTGQLIGKYIENNDNKIQAFISASGIGYYGAVSTAINFEESHPPHPGFLGHVCKEWEQSADSLTELGVRTVKLRIGIVLTRSGGALAKMIRPIKNGVASAIGTGDQFMPWIHIDDLCRIFIHAIENENINGAYNAVAPDHKTNKEFTMELGRILKRPFIPLKIPSFILKLVLGERAQLVLNGSRVSADKIQATGFNFLYSDLFGALSNLLSKN